jgi:hypothetical protein
MSRSPLHEGHCWQHVILMVWAKAQAVNVGGITYRLISFISAQFLQYPVLRQVPEPWKAQSGPRLNSQPLDPWVVSA